MKTTILSLAVLAMAMLAVTVEPVTANVCTVSAAGARQVRTSDYTSVAVRATFLIHDGATFIGTSAPTHQHSDYIVLAGGTIKCDQYKLGQFIRIWAAAGSTVDLASCKVDRFATIYYEVGTNIVWPAGGKAQFDVRNTAEQCSSSDGLVISNNPLDDGAAVCDRECHNGGSHDVECKHCAGCDPGWDEAGDCETCLPTCVHGTQDSMCGCTCEMGWTGENCDADICVVTLKSATIPVQVSDPPYLAIKTHTHYLVLENGLFNGWKSPTHVHSYVVVAPGAKAACAEPGVKKALSDFAKYYVMAGGEIDMGCVGSTSTLFYEKGAKIIWPSGGEAATAKWGWPGTDLANSRPKGPQLCNATGKITLLGAGAELCAAQCSDPTATSKDPSAVATVVASAGGGTLSQQQLTDAGVTNTGLSDDEINAVQVAIAYAYTCPIDSCGDWLAARTGTIWTPCPDNPAWTPADSSASCQFGSPVAGGEGNSKFLSLPSTTTAELQALTDTEVLKVAAVASREAAEAAVAVAVAAVITSAGAGILSQQQLTDAGVSNTGLSDDEINAVEAAIAAASLSDSPTTTLGSTAELQALTDTGVATAKAEDGISAEPADIAALKLAELNAELLVAQTALSQLKAEMAAAVASGATTDEIEAAQGKVDAAEVGVESAASAVQQATDGEGIDDEGDQGSGEVADVPVEPSKVPVIVGGVAGGAVFLCLLIVLFIFCSKKEDDSNGEGGDAGAGDDSRVVVVENPLYDTKE